MALLQVTLHSQALRRKVPITVILPVDPKETPEGDQVGRPFKTLYLLHGIFGSCASWTSGSRIQLWAEERNLAVVMPSADNAFYLDHPYNHYGEYVGQELVELTRRMFPLSRRRQDTFLAGFSMGGYGAIRNGLKYQETFGHIAGLSSAFILEKALGMGYDSAFMLQNRAFFEHAFGDLPKALQSDKNPKVLARDLRERSRKDPSVTFPRLFLACGTGDDLIDANRDFRDFLRGLGVEVSYLEGPGGHDWDYWDRLIRDVLAWLPLDPPVVEGPQRI